jgi:hypothetical protein
MYLKWGTIGEGEKEMRSKWGGGEVSLQPPRNLSGWELHHVAKEGFQVSRKGYGNRRWDFQAKGIIKGIGLCTPI